MKSKFAQLALLRITDYITYLGSCKESFESYAQQSHTPLV